MGIRQIAVQSRVTKIRPHPDLLAVEKLGREMLPSLKFDEVGIQCCSTFFTPWYFSVIKVDICWCVWVNVMCGYSEITVIWYYDEFPEQ